MTEISLDKIPGKLLSLSERTVCEKVAQQEIISDSKRATALLCIDDGMTQTQAAKASKMTLGQLRYALVLFKKSGLAMFADTDPAIVGLTPTTPPPAEEGDANVSEPVETEKINLTKNPYSAKVEEDHSTTTGKKEKKKMAKSKKKDKKKKDKKEQKLLSLKELSDKEAKKKAKKKKEKKKSKKKEEKKPKEASCKKKNKKNK